jgi:hypothetical protein
MTLYIPACRRENLQLVSNPLNYFIGVSQRDKEEVLGILEDDDFTQPLVVDIEQAPVGKHKVDFSFASEISKLSITAGTTLHIIKKCLKIVEDGQLIDFSLRAN